jgi:fructose-1,6-bisphosphatase/inositol monophosphatase family enzyme
MIVFDPVDSSVNFAANTGTWCIGAARIVGDCRSTTITTNVVFAPAINGGLLIVAQEGGGVTVVEDCGKSVIHLPRRIRERPINDHIIWRSVDTEQYPAVLRFWPQVAAKARATGVAMSGILGLALTAIGRGGAIIQMPQRIWDIVPALRITRMTGRKVIYFRLVDGQIFPVENLDRRAFCYGLENRLGLVAGEPRIVDELHKLLRRAGPLREFKDLGD